MASEASRPLLIPQNRRLRHIQGISLRNITLPRSRGRTIDDAGLNKSPEKLAALREALREPKLHHAQSTDALDFKARPGKLRRRSTIWAGQTSSYRQKKLEDVITSGLVDSFFSLHAAEIEEPIYISEEISDAMNPNFRFFDLSNYGPSIRRLSSLTIKIWVKRQEYLLLFEREIDLRTLGYIGTLEHRQLPPNCILFHLVDGIYTMDLTSATAPPKPISALPTSSYNSLMRLSSLDESIQDALSTRESLAAQINAIIQDNPSGQAPQAQEQAVLASRYVTAERKLLKQSMKRRSDLIVSLRARKQAIEEGRIVQERAQEHVTSATSKLEECRSLLNNANDDIRGQRRRICEELLHVFPIEPTKHTLVFTICGLELPNTLFDESDEEVIAAALGHVARLTDMLQYYLSVPLPYPIVPYGSRSVIRDEISTFSDSQRVFPLYTKGAVRFRFDYAVFLLNKDIESLAESQGLKVIDIRHTLPNLKYLLYVCSAGTTELPARKAGGIRGLLSGRVTPVSSRRGSDASAQGDLARKALENSTNGNAAQRSPASSALLFDPDTSASLRTRGLRENVVR